jgi:hypothetical protein
MQYEVHQGEVTCQSLMAKYAWIQLPDERNRWHLEQKWSPMTLAELISEPAEIVTHKTTGSSYTIHILRFADGGVITYQKGEANYLHTLNTLSLFKKKLWDLGLWTPGEM